MFDGRDTFEISIVETDGRATVSLRGDLDLASIGQVDHAGVLATHLARTEVHLDLCDLTFCDVCGLNEIVRLNRRCDAAGRPLVVDGASANFLRLVELTGLGSVLHLPHPSGAGAACPEATRPPAAAVG